MFYPLLHMHIERHWVVCNRSSVMVHYELDLGHLISTVQRKNCKIKKKRALVNILTESQLPTLCPKEHPPFYFSNNSVKN